MARWRTGIPVVATTLLILAAGWLETPATAAQDVGSGLCAAGDPTSRSDEESERLSEQATTVGSIAHLLFAAAEPLTIAPGSSNVMLPYLTRLLLRHYVMRSDRCGSQLATNLFRLSQTIAGPEERQDCPYTLYTAVQATFAWVRDNTPLTLRQLDRQPQATIVLPDTTLVPPEELTAAVYSALTLPAQLDDTGSTVEAVCGLDRRDLAALVPRLCSALEGLHADLPLLQKLGAKVASWSRGYHSKSERHARQRHLAGWAGRGGPGGKASALPNPEADSLIQNGFGGSLGAGERLAANARQRVLIHDQLPGTFNFSKPPGGFTAVGPSTLPPLLLPVVFHFLLYPDPVTGGIGPKGYDKASEYVDRVLHYANVMAKPTNIQFYAQEVRNDPVRFPQLMMPSRAAWLRAPDCQDADYCFQKGDIIYTLVSDFPKVINVIICSDDSTDVSTKGYSYVPGSDRYPEVGFIYNIWEAYNPSAYNTPKLYNYGSLVLMHEAFHFLGLQHTFGIVEKGPTACDSDDFVIDTPTSLSNILFSSYYGASFSYCMELFWGRYRGDWDVAYGRLSSRLGIPEEDMNAWVDSCPSKAGYDELGNYMGYNAEVCTVVLGHFTLGQVQRVYYMTSEMNPLLYAWGQYYAANAPPPSAVEPPPPEAYYDICKVTYGTCACKSSWTASGQTYSYCERRAKSSNPESLWCAVEDPSTCAQCPSLGSCVLRCAGTATQCRKPPMPGAVMRSPPPPRPPSPPPMPPPPPPVNVPDQCKVASNGCKCRHIWWQPNNDEFWTYCSPMYKMSSQLWCEVTPDCPTFELLQPYLRCDMSLTAEFCQSRQEYFSQLELPSSPPSNPTSGAPPPSPPPRKRRTSPPAPSQPSAQPPPATPNDRLVSGFPFVPGCSRRDLTLSPFRIASPLGPVNSTSSSSTDTFCFLLTATSPVSPSSPCAGMVVNSVEFLVNLNCKSAITKPTINGAAWTAAKVSQKRWKGEVYGRLAFSKIYSRFPATPSDALRLCLSLDRASSCRAPPQLCYGNSCVFSLSSSDSSCCPAGQVPY